MAPSSRPVSGVASRPISGFRMRPGSPSRPGSTKQNISRPSSAFLDNEARLAWCGPWGSGPLAASMPLGLSGNMPGGTVKVPRWDTTIGVRGSPQIPIMTVSIAEASSTYGREDVIASRGSSRGSLGKVRSGLLTQSGSSLPYSDDRDDRICSRGSSRASHFGSGNAGGKARSSCNGTGNTGKQAVRNWSAPALPKTEGVSSVSQYIAESRSKRLLLKDVIRNRLDDDYDGDNDAGLNDLCLFHSQAARSQQTNKVNRRKRPPLADDLASSSKQPRQADERQADKAAGAGGRRSSHGHTAGLMITEVQRLCGFLKKGTREHVRRMEDIRDGIVHTHAALAHPEITRKIVESQFREQMKREEAAGVGATEETCLRFGELIVFFLEMFGSLESAMQHLDQEQNKSLNKKQFMKSVELQGYLERGECQMARIFAVLDQDHDGEISYQDLTCFQPRASSHSAPTAQTSSVSFAIAVGKGSAIHSSGSGLQVPKALGRHASILNPMALHLDGPSPNALDMMDF